MREMLAPTSAIVGVGRDRMLPCSRMAVFQEEARSSNWPHFSRGCRRRTHCCGSEWGSDWDWYSWKETQPSHLQRRIEKKIIQVETAEEKAEGLSQTICETRNFRQYGRNLRRLIANPKLRINLAVWNKPFKIPPHLLFQREEFPLFSKEGLGEIFTTKCLFNYGLLSNSLIPQFVQNRHSIRTFSNEGHSGVNSFFPGMVYR